MCPSSVCTHDAMQYDIKITKSTSGVCSSIAFIVIFFQRKTLHHAQKTSLTDSHHNYVILTYPAGNYTRVGKSSSVYYYR